MSARWLAGVAVVALALGGCATRRPAPAPPAEPPAEVAAPVPAPDTRAEAIAAYERHWRDTAAVAARQRRLADAAWAWSVVATLRPDDADVARRRADIDAQIKLAVAERWPRAQQAQVRGDAEAAVRLYLEIVALAPDHAAAADALRAIERQRAPRAAQTPGPGPSQLSSQPQPQRRARPARGVNAPLAASSPAR